MASSFDVLHLLADLLELRLHSDDLLGHHRVADLRPDGVDLAVHLLQQEIQAPPYRLSLSEERPELVQMAVQAGQLLAPIAAIGNEPHPPRQTALRHAL